MQYDVTTPSEYIDQLEDDWRKSTLEEIRVLITENHDLIEGINYKMLSYRDDKGILFHLNAQKNYVSLYVGNANNIDTDGTLLKGLNVGKGCIRLTKSIKIEETQLKEFIDRAIYLWINGADIGC